MTDECKQERHGRTTEVSSESIIFAQSTEFTDWKRPGAGSDRSKHLLYVKVAPGDSLSLDHPVATLGDDLQRPGPGPCPFDFAFYLANSPPGETVRASEVLRQLLAQVIIFSFGPNGVPSDRVSSFNLEQRIALLQALQSSQSLEQRRYWDLVSAMLGNHVLKPLLLVFERVDMIDMRDRSEFLKELTRVWERCQPGDWLRVLISSQPCSGELEDLLSREQFTCFDPHREYFSEF